MKKIKVQSLIRWNGFYLHITGKTNANLSTRNAVSLCLNQNWINYIKQINNFIERKLTVDDEHELTREKNQQLFSILADKHKNGIYAKKPNSLVKKIVGWQECFNSAALESQAEALYELLKVTECANNSMKAEKLGFSVTKMSINKNVNLADELLLINQSPSGLFENVIDLKTV